MKTVILIVSAVVSMQVLAKGKAHREHGAHQHGAGT